MLVWLKCNLVFLRHALRRAVLFGVFAFFPTLTVFTQQSRALELELVQSYQIQPGDRLSILVYREKDLSGIYEVDLAGQLVFPLIGEIDAAGTSIEDFRERLVDRLKKYLVDPQVSISRTEGAIKSISVLGEVNARGTYDYAPGSTLMRLISEAGGFAPTANKKKIKIIRMVNGEKTIQVVNGSDIIGGKGEDPKVQPGDIIFVPESLF